VTPFAASIYYDLPVLLVAFALVYSATRHDRWDLILKEAADWGLRVGGFLLTVGIVLAVASSFPDRWPYVAAGFGGLFGIYWWVKHRLAKRAAKSQQQPAPLPPAAAKK
jgi:uncharacterized membrane protein YjfL (UPF0719 family)